MSLPEDDPRDEWVPTKEEWDVWEQENERKTVRPSARDVAREFFGCIPSPDPRVGHGPCCMATNCDRLARLIEREREGAAEAKIAEEAEAAPLVKARDIDGKFAVSSDGRIFKKSSGETIPDDEPLFLLRARDRLAVPALREYRRLSAEDFCNDYHFEKLDGDMKAFEDFAWTKPERMKQPSVTRGAPWVPPAAPQPCADAAESRCAELEREIANLKAAYQNLNRDLCGTRWPTEPDNWSATQSGMYILVRGLERRAEQAEAERDRLREQMRDVAASGVVLDDERIGYLTVQIDRATWDALRAALQGRDEGGDAR